MIPAPRRTDGPLPGDLYLDSAVPECERLTMTRNGWSAQATHVWTGTGWTRLVPGAVREVPTHPVVATGAATRPAAPARPSTETSVARWRARSAQREAAKAAAAAERSGTDWSRISTTA